MEILPIARAGYATAMPTLLQAPRRHASIPGLNAGLKSGSNTAILLR
jgi:hypothetical protein